MSGLEEAQTDFKRCDCREFEFWCGYLFSHRHSRDLLVVFFNPDSYCRDGRPKVLFERIGLAMCGIPCVTEGDKRDILSNKISSISCCECGRIVNAHEKEEMLRQAHVFMNTEGAYFDNEWN